MSVTRKNLLIQRVGNIDYSRRGRVFDFKDPEKDINDLIENVARLVSSGENGEFRLVYCAVNQFPLNYMVENYILILVLPLE